MSMCRVLYCIAPSTPSIPVDVLIDRSQSQQGFLFPLEASDLMHLLDTAHIETTVCCINPSHWLPLYHAYALGIRAHHQLQAPEQTPLARAKALSALCQKERFDYLMLHPGIPGDLAACLTGLWQQQALQSLDNLRPQARTQLIDAHQSKMKDHWPTHAQWQQALGLLTEVSLAAPRYEAPKSTFSPMHYQGASASDAFLTTLGLMVEVI